MGPPRVSRSATSHRRKVFRGRRAVLAAPPAPARSAARCLAVPQPSTRLCALERARRRWRARVHVPLKSSTSASPVITPDGIPVRSICGGERGGREGSGACVRTGAYDSVRLAVTTARPVRAGGRPRAGACVSGSSGSAEGNIVPPPATAPRERGVALAFGGGSGEMLIAKR